MQDQGKDLHGLFMVDDSALKAASDCPFAARELIESFRWPDGPLCPKCGSRRPRRIENRSGRYEERWRCSDAHHDVKWNWRVGTAFFGLHSRPDLILRALRSIKGGEPAFRAITQLREVHGLSILRAHHLVVAILELAVASAIVREGESSAAAQALQAQLRSTLQAQGVAARPGRAWARRVAAAALLLAPFLLGTLTGHGYDEKVHVWYCNGSKRRYVCERLQGESLTDWAIRFREVLRSMKTQFPPD